MSLTESSRIARIAREEGGCVSRLLGVRWISTDSLSTAVLPSSLSMLSFHASSRTVCSTGMPAFGLISNT